MTQITGKIFPMYDKTGQNRRFPETVIEAVLGLSSYLQNRFSSLADIYMPIGGIYQSKTGQEFVYRATPNTIKAKSFTLDRIQGRTDAWNQLVRNGDFEDGTGWSADGCTATFTNNEATITNVGVNGASCKRTDINFVAGHKYYIGCDAKSGDLTSNYIMLFDGTNSVYLTLTSIASSYKRYGFIRTINTSSTTGQIQLFRTIDAIAGTVVYKNVRISDLTLLYGSEIDGMTDAQILAKFESEYPGYHDYSAGKLISNDAKQLETVGKNVWDEEWRNGYYNNNGEFVSNAGWVCCKNPIPAFENTVYYIESPIACSIYAYDANGEFIQAIGFYGHQIFTTPAGTHFIKFHVLNSYGNVYNHDICINLSDESFNGQYEHYRKVILPLNLDDFWVKDSQGNLVHITGGLKSAGSVYDEIVGNKYIKRVGSVDLGSLNWVYDSDNGVFVSASDGRFPNKTLYLVCSKYAATTVIPSAMGNGEISGTTYYGYGKLTVKDSTMGTDAEAFKTAMNGVMLNYELATPIEYDLVEPLIYTMKAGTTEARISPNEDGLSAPFCCDMTYSASDNNDADNAQYAATAGRLLNTHTILGQQFNGTQNIGGAISDVSSIDGAIHFDTTNPNSPLVGIGTASPTVRLDVNGEIKGSRLHSTVANGTAPLTVVSGTMVPTLNVEKVGGKTLAEILASDITGNAKTATNAKSESKDDQEFMFRKTNVDWDAKSGVVKKIEGKTLAWNQLAPKLSTAVTVRGVTCTPNADGSYTFNGTATGGTAEFYLLINKNTISANHSVLFSISGNINVSFLAYGYNYAEIGVGELYATQIIQITGDLYYLQLRVPGSRTANNEKVYFNVFDLTQMFGAGNEPSTVAEFEALYSDAYYPYNPGTLISNDAEAVETTGVNQWDEEVTYGKYWNDNLQQESASSSACGSHRIKVFPNTDYYFAHTAPAGSFPEIKFGTADGSFISKITDILSPRIITTPNNCEYIYLNIFGTFTYNHDICINISNQAIDGQYFPYWKRDLQLGLNSFKVKDAQGNVTTVNGLKSAGSVHDEIDFGRMKYIKRVGSVDLGTLNYVGNGGRFYAGISNITTYSSSATSLGNLCCSGYSVITAKQWYDKTNVGIGQTASGYGGANSIAVYDTAFENYTGGQVATALSGVMLYYELATYEEYDLVDPIPSVYPCDQYGTERIISPESTTPSAPFIADLQYGAKSDDVAKELIDTRATVQPLLDAFEYDSTNEAWRLKGNFYADGFVSAYGTNESEALQALKDWVTENFEPKQS